MCRNAKPIVFSHTPTNSVHHVWKPCNTWGCSCCIEAVRARWIASVIRNLSHGQGWYYTATVHESEWRSRIYPEIKRRAKRLDVDAQYYAVWRGEQVTIFSTVAFAGCDAIRRRQAIPRLRELINAITKTRTRPITCSHGWGPVKEATKKGWEFLGVGIPVAHIASIAASLRDAGNRILESGGFLYYSVSTVEAFGELVRRVRCLCGAANSTRKRIGDRISTAVLDRAEATVENEVQWAFDTG